MGGALSYKSLEKLRAKTIYLFSAVGITFTLVFGVAVHISSGNTLYALYELILTLIASINLIYFHYRRNYSLASTVILLVMVATLGFLLVTGGSGGTGAYWIHTFPILSLFLKDKKAGSLWSALFGLFIIVLMSLEIYGYNLSFYEAPQLRQALGSYFAVFFLTLFFKHIENEAIKQLEKLATRDALTGVFSRSFILDMLDSMIEVAKRKKDRGYCLVYADLDNFKRVNDYMGHAEGDLVLKKVANIISEHFRKGDVVGRIGGDEFLILIYDCDYPALEKRLAQLEKKIETLMKPYRISISYGIARIPEEAQTPDEALKLVDRRMYEMKNRKKTGK